MFWGASAMAGQAVVDMVDGASVDARRSAAYQQAVERRAMLRGAAVEAASRGIDPRAALQGTGAAELLLGPGVAKDSEAAELVDGAAAARAVAASMDPRERWVVENGDGTFMGRDTTRRLRRLLWESGLFVNAAQHVPLRGAVACLDGRVLDPTSGEGKEAVASGTGTRVYPPPRSSLAVATVPVEVVSPGRLAHVVDELGLVGPLKSKSDQSGDLAGSSSAAEGSWGTEGVEAEPRGFLSDPFGFAWSWLARHTKGLVPLRRVSEDYVEVELKRRLHEIDLALQADDAFRAMLE